MRRNGQADMPFFRIFNGVGQEVKNYLPQPHFVPHEVVGDKAINVGKKPDWFFHEPHSDDVYRIVDKG